MNKTLSVFLELLVAVPGRWCVLLLQEFSRDWAEGMWSNLGPAGHPGWCDALILLVLAVAAAALPLGEFGPAVPEPYLLHVLTRVEFFGQFLFSKYFSYSSCTLLTLYSWCCLNWEERVGVSSRGSCIFYSSTVLFMGVCWCFISLKCKTLGKIILISLKKMAYTELSGELFWITHTVLWTTFCWIIESLYNNLKLSEVLLCDAILIFVISQHFLVISLLSMAKIVITFPRT